jgi:hypothetical protein
MLSGTSPSITTTTDDGTMMAFQANTGVLWYVNQSGDGIDQGSSMMSGTSPSIGGLSSGGYETAFQGSNGDLWTEGTYANGDSGLAMMSGTSPSIT